MEKPPEDIYKRPDDFAFVDYGNELFPFGVMLKNKTSFSEILKELKMHPVKTTAEYLEASKEVHDYEKLLSESRAYPGKMARLDTIAEELNSLEESDEPKFRKLIDEA